MVNSARSFQTKQMNLDQLFFGEELSFTTGIQLNTPIVYKYSNDGDVVSDGGESTQVHIGGIPTNKRQRDQESEVSEKQPKYDASLREDGTICEISCYVWEFQLFDYLELKELSTVSKTCKKMNWLVSRSKAFVQFYKFIKPTLINSPLWYHALKTRCFWLFRCCCVDSRKRRYLEFLGREVTNKKGVESFTIAENDYTLVTIAKYGDVLTWCWYRQYVAKEYKLSVESQMLLCLTSACRYQNREMVQHIIDSHHGGTLLQAGRFFMLFVESCVHSTLDITKILFAQQTRYLDAGGARKQILAFLVPRIIGYIQRVNNGTRECDSCRIEPKCFRKMKHIPKEETVECVKWLRTLLE